MRNKKLDIIIPCLNERQQLGRTLQALLIHMRAFEYDYDIILIDNGSTDGSPELAREIGIKTKIKPNCSISELRNFGAANLSGDFIAFIDADIEITEEWARTISDFVRRTNENALILTGSPCLRPPDASLLEKHWFNGKEFSEANLNSGNLVTTRRLFEKISGFDTAMPSGEDWDFCDRAKANGAFMRVDYGLKVYHHGFPKDLIQFLRREYWHGMGDFISLKHFIKSKPAILAVLAGLFMTMSLFSLLILNSYNLVIICLVWLLAVSFVISTKRSENIWQIPGNLLLAVLYIFARLGSFIRTILETVSSMFGRLQKILGNLFLN